MIRGILILLALVVLTLGEDCTCKDYSGGDTVEESAQGSWHIAALVDFDWNGADVTTAQGYASEVTTNWATAQGLQDWFGTVTTAAISQTVTDLTATQTAVNTKVAALTAKSDELQAQVELIVAKILNWKANLIKRLKENYDPQLAAQWFNEYLEISTQSGKIERATGYIQSQLPLFTTWKQIVDTRLNIYNQLKTIAEDIDDTEGSCLCGRLVAIGQVFLAQASKVTSLSTQIGTFGGTVNAWIASVNQIKTDHPEYFQPSTPEDDAKDTQRTILFSWWEDRQNQEWPTYEQFQGAVTVLLSSDPNLQALIAGVTGIVSDEYDVTGTSLSCTGYNDQTGITTCDLVGKIATSGSGTLADGVAKILLVLRQTLIAMLGAGYAECVDASVDTATTGNWKITCTCVKDKVDIFVNTAKDKVIAAKYKLADVKTDAETAANEHIKKVVTDVVADIDTAITSYETARDNAAQAAADKAAAVKASLDLCDESKESYRTAQAALRDNVEATSDALAEFYADSITVWTDFKKDQYEDRKACVAAYLRDLDQATCAVASAAAALLQAKSDYLHDQTDEALKYWNGAKDGLEADVKEACVAQDAKQKLHDAIQEAVTEYETNKDAWIADFQAQYDKIEANEDQTAEECQATWAAKQEQWKQIIADTIYGFCTCIRPGSVDVSFVNVDGAQGKEYVKCLVSFINDATGQTAAETDAQNQIFVKAAVGACAGSKHVVVAGAVGNKRQASGDAYEATLGTAPPGTEPGAPASANTLVFSVVLAIVSSFMLVWF